MVRMSLNAFRLPASPLPPPAVPGGSSPKESSVSMVKTPLRPFQLQVRGNVEHNLLPIQASPIVSRRDLALGLVAAASLGVASLSLTETAEARVVKPEVRRKIFEKLKMLREKAGLSKPKAENEEKPTAPSPSTEDLKLLPPLPLPNLKSNSGSSLIEATLP